MGENKHNPSKEQQDIFSIIKKGVGKILINAKAGSGKTTTIVESLKYIDNSKTVLLIAHNKKIADELKSRVDRNKETTKIFTYHGLGYRILKECLTSEKLELSEYKYVSYIHKNLDFLSGGALTKLTYNQKKRYKSNINTLVNYARYNKCQVAKEMKGIIKKYGIPVISNECEVVEKILKWGKQNLDTIDFTDMIWLPYELNLHTKKYKSDWIIVDEAQDTSPIQEELFMKCYKRGVRIILVGDEKQCINVWCGSNERMFDEFLQQDYVTKMPLNVSYRCSKAVIEKAQEFVPDITHCEDAIEGSINYETDPMDAKDGDMVLCRNLSPLAKLYADYLREGKKAHIIGSEFTNDMIDKIIDIKYDKINVELTEKGIMSELYKEFFDLCKDLMISNSIDFEDVLASQEALNYYDTIKTIESLSYDINTKEGLIKRFKDVFTDCDNEGVRLSSIHKAKGLEADNVFILCPSLMPSMLAKTKLEKEAERNLEYVAITRAKKTLNYVSEKLYPTEFNVFKDINMIRNLNDISESITDLYENDMVPF